jgi:hypothetical protein
MPTETTGRPLLPQTAQMQSFTFAPPTLAPRENQRSEYLVCYASGELETDRVVQIMYLWTSTTDISG